jgi:haloalkane dehalogenase
MSEALTAAALEPGWLDRDAYPFPPRTLDLPAGRMHYVDVGRGEPILFVHGTPTWSFEYRHLIRALSASHRCIAPDHLGFGLSARPPGLAYTPEMHAANLAALVERLDLRDLTLVVHDYGGPIGLPIAIDTPRVRRLAILNTWMWPLDDDPTIRRPARLASSWLGRVLYRRANLSLRVIMPGAYGDRAALTPAIHRQYLAPFRSAWARGAVLWPLAGALMGSRAHYARLWQARARLRGRPAAVVWGVADSAFRPHHLARWRDVVPDADVTALDRAGHWPHEEQPDAVLDALRRLLARS